MRQNLIVRFNIVPDGHLEISIVFLKIAAWLSPNYMLCLVFRFCFWRLSCSPSTTVSSGVHLVYNAVSWRHTRALLVWCLLPARASSLALPALAQYGFRLILGRRVTTSCSRLLCYPPLSAQVIIHFACSSLGSRFLSINSLRKPSFIFGNPTQPRPLSSHNV